MNRRTKKKFSSRSVYVVEPLEERSLLSVPWLNAEKTTAISYKPDNVELADFNNDGNTDLLLVSYAFNYGEDVISVRLGNGQGGFGDPISGPPLTDVYPGDAVLADFNLDGKVDLFLVDKKPLDPNSSVFLAGNGDGTFKSPVRFPINNYNSTVISVDVNSDSKPDLVASCFTAGDQGHGAINVFLGKGNGSFEAPKSYYTVSDPWNITAADINGDNKPDLALLDTTYYSGDGYQILFNNGDGTFGNPKHLSTGALVSTFGLADVNNDGRVDFVTMVSAKPSGARHKIGVLLNNGSGWFGPMKQFDVENAEDTVFGDFNGDKNIDVLVSDDTSFYILAGDGKGNFCRPIPFSSSTRSILVAGNFNQDNKTDIFSINGGYVGTRPLTIIVRLAGTPHASAASFNHEDKFFEFQNTEPGKSFGDHFTKATMADGIPIAGDWNGDGLTDAGLRIGSVFYLDSNGDMRWDAGDQLFSFGTAADKPLVGDWNGDGKDEVGISRDNFFWLDKNGDHIAGPNDLTMYFGSPGDTTVIGDFNGDKIDDIGVYRGNVFYLDSNGSHDWNSGIDLAIPFGLAGDIPLLGDWTGDGITDLGVRRQKAIMLDFDGSRTWTPATDYRNDDFGSGATAFTTIAGVWF